MYTIKQGERTDYNYKEIFCDTQNDFDTLDLNSAEFLNICVGSVAYVIETSNVYILNSKGEWVAQSSGGGGGGGDIHNKNKTITENGEYTADPGYTGLGIITVDVPSGGDEYFANNIVSGRIPGEGIAIYIKKLPDNLDISNMRWSNLFAECKNLESVDNISFNHNKYVTESYTRMFQDCYLLKTVPYFDTSKTTDISYMFSGCHSLLEVPLLDISNITNMAETFYMCYELKVMPQWNTSKVQSFSQCWLSCSALESIPLLDFSNASNIYRMISQGTKSLITLGGFKNLGQAFLTTASANNYNYALTLNGNTNLTHDSLMNVINNLYDIAEKGCNTQKLELGSTNLAKLSADEIAIATNKGWTVS